jgi:hypothetical protein
MRVEYRHNYPPIRSKLALKLRKSRYPCRFQYFRWFLQYKYMSHDHGHVQGHMTYEGISLSFRGYGRISSLT